MPRVSPAPSADRVCVHLLGAFRVERGTQTIRFPARKVESLFAFLVLHPEAHPREKLAALLWGDSTDEQARHSLRTALATIRKELGDDVLLADRETVQIDPGFAIWVDAKEIERFRDLEINLSIPQSLSLYADLLPDFFDDWILPERERLRAIYLDALLQIAQAHRAKSEYANAIECAQKILAHDPANEKAYQHLIFCLAAAGDRIGALKQYDECEKKLRDELGVEPSPETRALRDQIEQALSGGKAREAMFTNVPVPLTSFVGREKEKREIREMMERARLVTLTGSGGAGKTRLAIQVATELANANRFKNGVWWVELASLSDATLVARTVASVFNLDEAPNTPILTTLTNYLRAKDLLLILDNCEHLIDACAQLADALLRACPQLKILASSREALGIVGETPYKIPSLSLPSPESNRDLNAITQSEAVQLFVERARTLAPAFALTQTNAATVAQICERLDGIPLALELAAARIKSLSIEQIAARLDDRFRLLTGGSRTALPRQQTLRAAIDWSYDLLSEAERIVLQRLSVFAGGFSLESVEAICSEQSSVNSQQSTVNNQLPTDHYSLFTDPCSLLDLLAHLADKSLVIVEPRDDETRYRLMETIRQYARDRLLESGQVETIRDRHLDFFVAFAENIEPKLMGAEQFAWLDRLDLEHDNLRAAMDWSQSPGRAQKGLRLVGALRLYWDLRAHTNEAYTRLQKLLARPEAAEKTLARARALFTLAVLAENVESGKAARPYLEETVELARACGAPGQRQLAMSLAELSLVIRADQPERAQALEDEGWAIAQALGDEWVSATILHYRGHRFMREGNRQTVRAAFEASHSLFSKLGDQHWAMVLYRDIAGIHFREGDYATARRQNEKALQFFREQKDRLSTGGTLIMLGEIARAEQDYPRAKKCYEEALAIAQDLGASIADMSILGNLGVTMLRLGDVVRARKLLAEQIEYARQAARAPIVIFTLERFAFVATAEKQFARAARLFGAVDALKTRAENAYTPADAAEREYYFTIARAQLDEATFSAARAEGQTMSREQAIEYALNL